ncbi:hypothetical protein VUR80DRAFT_8570 [Thermomyces stellatus]
MLSEYFHRRTPILRASMDWKGSESKSLSLQEVYWALLDENWPAFVRVVDSVPNKVQASGLMSAIGEYDWANGSAPNTLLYYTLKTALVLFNLTDINLAVGYDTRAADLAEPILEHLWDE